MKTAAVFIIIASVLIAGAIMLAGGTEENLNNVSVENGTQIITINAKGGYSPRVTSARAGIPTIIKVDTRGTFDCSSALAIPSIGYRSNLPPSGTTEIEIPSQKPGSVLQGLCAMGMYNFQIRFN